MVTDSVYNPSEVLKKTEKKAKGFGTFYGVYLPALVTMLGMLSFLPLGKIVANTSLTVLIFIISFAGLITLLTALSIAKVSSNMTVKQGGIYYILSRSFGLEVGASMGIALYVAHTIMISLCIMGVSGSIAPFFPGFSVMQIGLCILLLLVSIAYYSAGCAIKTQFIILLFIVFSLIVIGLGNYQIKEIDFIGVLKPSTEQTLPFWVAFALFYPALTGIEAGAALSGELKTPGRSIALGCLSVTITGFLIYLMLALMLYIKVPSSYLRVDESVWQHLSSNPLVANIGFWLAALSSALGCFISAPRTLYAIAEDGIFPKWIAKLQGNAKEPRIALLITACFASIGILLADVSQIAAALTLVFLIIYGMLNLVTALEDWMDTPSWRPTFRIHWISALLGSFLCLFSMLMIDAGKAFTSSAIVLSIYLAIRYKKPGGKFDDIRQTLLFFLARYSIYRLAYSKPSLRSWRPNFLVLSESGGTKSPLLLLTNQMTQDRGFLTLASVVRAENTEMEKIETWEEVIKGNLKKNKIRALVEVSPAKDLTTGLRNIIQNYGCGNLVPNTVVLGECERKEHFSDYVDILRMAAFANRNLLIVRGKTEFFETMNHEIDLWWDDRRKQNTDLMILLAYLLEKSKVWKKAKLTFKSVVFEEKALEERHAFLTSFCENARLSAHVDIFTNKRDKDPHETIANQSTNKGLVFFGLKEPQEDETVESYHSYIETLFEDTKHIPFACFVLCRQKIDLHKILI